MWSLHRQDDYTSIGRGRCLLTGRLHLIELVEADETVQLYVSGEHIETFHDARACYEHLDSLFGRRAPYQITHVESPDEILF
jgi:hypothetical protein